ncbi:cobalamin biosynthesis protein [Candidatus Borrarchaeum sp.]|uniref:cobalamin biosynthesis protein n=1 Tax=Candidatus Borrarchaeum sp. TaxID=2846742 RepID=UPI00257D2864|nr:cobalamin biosynthesis protein [Candidatus Borrarchaeum sp.]
MQNINILSLFLFFENVLRADQRLQMLITIFLAFLIDLTVGEPPESIHPVVLIGKVIRKLKNALKHQNPRIEKFNGLILAVSTIIIFVIPLLSLLMIVRIFLGILASILFAAYLLKTTFSMKFFISLISPIANALERNDIEDARNLVSRVVGRDTSILDSRLVASAAVETTAEGIPDSLISPIFYFIIFGVFGIVTGIIGALVFRAVSTLDSMVGYKDSEHINIGMVSARLDDVANFIPARLSALLIVIASALLRENYKNSWKIMWRDGSTTSSINSGWVMAAAAGALNVQLEKPGNYLLGDAIEVVNTSHIFRTTKILKFTILLFILFICFPLILFSPFVSRPLLRFIAVSIASILMVYI